ncbi:SCO1664 family protein [Salinifilum ghardaiensis]
MGVLHTDEHARELLTRGQLDVRGRLVAASNATLLCGVESDGVRAECVYKPVRGERPLWDFPNGTLAGREVAAALVSDALGWHLTPPTLLRDGPFGPGMVQLWVDDHSGAGLVDVVRPEETPESWRIVLHAEDEEGEPVVLAHADDERLQRMAVFDAVINNSDRKAGHILHTAGGRVLGVDHGVSLHTEDKLRTVLWGWTGEPLPAWAVEQLRELRSLLEGSLAAQLVEHIDAAEVRAAAARVDRLLESGTFPEPPEAWPAIPWPPF